MGTLSLAIASISISIAIGDGTETRSMVSSAHKTTRYDMICTVLKAK